MIEEFFAFGVAGMGVAGDDQADRAAGMGTNGLEPDGVEK